MRNPENIKEVEQLDVDWMGFIFYPKSTRFVDNLPTYMPQSAKRIGVFVNEQYDHIVRVCQQYSLDYVQLHGNEPPQLCTKLMLNNIGVIKAFSVGSVFPNKTVLSYQHTCNYFLFDTQTELYGGSGNKFNWDILNDYTGSTPFLLSGGISADDAETVNQINHPQLAGIDLNSKFEIEPALKDVAKLKYFLKQLKQR